jgi:DNA (cytosine-5)-methyltransferase 1
MDAYVNDTHAAEKIEAAEEILLDRPVPAAAADPLSDLLKKSKTILERRRRAIAKAVFDMAKEIDGMSAHLPRAELRAYLTSECGIDRSDLNTYLKLTRTLGSGREAVQKSGASFACLKALAAAPEEVRGDAVGRMASGRFVHSGDITAMRRRHAALSTDPRVEEERKRLKALRSAARDKAQSNLEAFNGAFLPFVQSLVDLFNDGVAETVSEEDYRTRRALLVDEAGRCLDRFKSLFDTASLPPAWDGYYEEHRPNEARLARAHESLSDLAAGTWKTVDPESGNPYDDENLFLDRSIVESLIWLFDGNGIPASLLKSRNAPVFARPKATRPSMRLTSLEICAGAGGQALGLHAAGFDSIATFERNKDAVASLKASGLFRSIQKSDITKVDFRRYRGKVDLVAGGVPCQPHSRGGKQEGREDKRDLFLEAVRLVDEVKPRAFFFENVSGFGDAPNAAYRAELHRKFSALGYENRVFAFAGKDLGLAQLRPRIAFIGFRDLPMGRFRMPPTFPEWETTLGEALFDLVAANGWQGAEHWAKKEATRTCPTIVGGSEKSGSQGFSAKARGDDWDDLGIDWKKLADAAPGPDHPFKGKFRLTLEMGARLQGFPDDWAFCGSPRARRRQIANALPPIMARAVGLAIYSALTGTEFDFGKALKLPLPASHRKGLNLALLRGHDWAADGEAHPF